jgi:hypothetical protein
VIDRSGRNASRRVADGFRAGPLSGVNAGLQAQRSRAQKHAREGVCGHGLLVSSETEPHDRFHGMPLVEIEHPLRRLGAPVTDPIEEDLTGNPGLSRPFPQTGDDSVQTGGGIQADPGKDLRRNVDFGVPHASGCQSARNLAGRVAIVFRGPEEPADLGEQGEKNRRRGSPSRGNRTPLHRQTGAPHPSRSVCLGRQPSK